MNFVFFVGNKRSGTTLLNRAINLHPNLYSAHEADIINWMFQSESPSDWTEGLERTNGLLGTPKEEPSINYMVQSLIELKDFEGPNAYKTEILYCGDKKPVQHLEEGHLNFLKDAPVKYIHVVRNPVGFLLSSTREGFQERYDLNKWVDEPTDEKLLNFWAGQIRKVESLSLKKPVLTVRLEDFIASPHEELLKIFQYLDLPQATADHNVQSLKIDPKRALDLPKLDLPENIKELAIKYGYPV